VKQSTNEPLNRPATQQRAFDRRAVMIPARLTWKDQRGATRFASVVTRNVSEFGVYVECQSAVSIPLYRLVYFQFEREARESDGVPAAIRQGRILAAVYRVATPTMAGARQGLALRLMIDPKRVAAAIPAVRTLARASA
jgi:hypothetical protein